ncbi:MAG TPA: DUF4870 domain-containing protein [Steroidobacteraceae bacterium]|nr:DUF4870 domain-containing protein [Steroidobacteraceae bacterium]
MNSDPTTGTPGKAERDWALFAHLSALLVYITLIGGILAPFVIWLIKREEMPFAGTQAKEALNFQITVYLAAVVLGFLTIVLIGLPLLAALVIAHVVLTIIATMKASEGIAYRYPFNLRLIA